MTMTGAIAVLASPELRQMLPLFACVITDWLSKYRDVMEPPLRIIERVCCFFRIVCARHVFRGTRPAMSAKFVLKGGSSTAAPIA